MESNELCDSCSKNEAEEPHTCPYMRAKYCEDAELSARLCDCCDECHAKCEEKA